MDFFIFYLISDHLNQLNSKNKPRLTIFQFILMLVVVPPTIGMIILGALIVMFGSWQELLAYMLLVGIVIGFKYGLSLLKSILINDR